MNIVVFLFTMLFSSDLFIYQFALVPAFFRPETLITSLFLHASFGHIIGNMLFLHVFGDSLEDHFGHFKFLALYLFCGAIAGLTQMAFSLGSDIPIIGASGAIAGLMGAYLVLFPRSKIDVLIPFGIYASNATVSAPFMLLYWIAAQFFYSLGAIGLADSGVAYFAHIGGFVVGWLVAKIVPRKPEIMPDGFWPLRFS